MSRRFFDAYEKAFPREKKEEPNQQQPTGMSFQDMKDYFDAMQEKMRNDMRKEMSEYIKAQEKQKEPEPKVEQEEKEKEGNNNAGNSSV